MNTTYVQVYYLVVVGLHLHFIFACLRAPNVRITLEFQWLARFWVLLAFLDQPFWLLQLSMSNASWITTSMLAFQVPHLVYLQKAASPYTREKWPLFKEPSLIPNWNSFVWLIQMMDLTWCVTLNPSLSPFLSTYLSPFLSTKRSAIVTRT